MKERCSSQSLVPRIAAIIKSTLTCPVWYRPYIWINNNIRHYINKLNEPCFRCPCSIYLTQCLISSHEIIGEPLTGLSLTYLTNTHHTTFTTRIHHASGRSLIIFNLREHTTWCYTRTKNNLSRTTPNHVKLQHLTGEAQVFPFSTAAFFELNSAASSREPGGQVTAMIQGEVYCEKGRKTRKEHHTEKERSEIRIILSSNFQINRLQNWRETNKKQQIFR